MQKRNDFIILATPAPVSHRTAEENLGIGYLCAVLRQRGFKVKVLDAWLNNWSPQELATQILNEETPLFVGIAAYQSNMDQAAQTLNLVKEKSNIPFVAGGFGPTFSPDLFLNKGFDFVVRGEGEKAIIDIAELFQNQKTVQDIYGISYKSNDKIINNPIIPINEDLDSLPFPARDTMNLAQNKRTPIHLLTARGCSGFCDFCSINAFFKLSRSRKWRGRSIPNIIDELCQLKSQGVQHIKVIDDSFIDGNRDEKWCHDFAQQLKNNNLYFDLRGSIRADKVSDNILYELKNAGFFSFSCGIENFSNSALHRMSKGASVEQNCNALDLFHKYDFYVQAGQILFDPYTTIAELKENYKYMRKYDWIISKGVFTEMFAAEGSSFQKQITAQHLTDKRNSALGNYNYEIQNSNTKLVYDALKRWHTAHMKFYDKAIDPLTSPKALTQDEMKLFYKEYLKIRDIDLDTMERILILADTKKNSIMDFVEEQILKTAPIFRQIEDNVDSLYQTCNLKYIANVNPFIKVH